jgi:lipopolysaccharide export system protein LptC
MPMMRNITILFPLLLLGLIALITYWVSISVQPTGTKSDGSTRHDPDYAMYNFVTTQTDVKGALRYKLSAVQMKHFPDDDSTDLIKPVYTQFVEGKSSISVEGLYGEVSSNGSDIKLYKQVKLTRAPYGEKAEMTLETDYLNILPEEDLVLTQKPVVIRQAPKTVVYANGMVYEKKKLTVTLLNKVRAHYEKPVYKSKKIDSLAHEDQQNVGTKISSLRDKAALPGNLPTPEVSEQKTHTIDQHDTSSEPNTSQNTTQKNQRIRRRYD